MATAIQRRRGTTSQHSSFTGLAGEITIDTDKNTVVVHDGSTAGGFPLAKYTDVSALGGADITDVVAGSGLTGGATSGSATISIDYDGIAGSLIPTANITYDLGSLTKQWRDIYVGPGSLYVNGTKVLEDSSGTIQFTADNNQNISILTTGSGDLELTSGGSIQLKSDIAITTDKTISSTGGVKFASNINVNSNHINGLVDPVQANDATRKSYVDGTTYLTGGDGITNSSSTLAVDSTVVRTTGVQTIAGNKTFSNDVTVNGTLASAGGTLTVADNLIDLNAGTTGTPSENVGIKVDRGDSTDVIFRWNETDDQWEFTNNGSDYYGVIGLEQLNNLVLSTVVMDRFKGIPDSVINMESFWKHSIACGLAARVIASHRKEINTERFFVAGMLHDVGRLVLAMSAPFSILSVFMRCKAEEISLHDAEKSILGFSHTDVGQLLLKNWKLPDFHQNIVGNHHQPGSSIDLESGILNVADHIANDLKLGDSGEGLSPAPLDLELWEKLQLPEDTNIEKIKAEVEQLYNSTSQVFLQAA